MHEHGQAEKSFAHPADPTNPRQPESGPEWHLHSGLPTPPPPLPTSHHKGVTIRVMAVAAAAGLSLRPGAGVDPGADSVTPQDGAPGGCAPAQRGAFAT
jgi:hypothetical protein